MPSGAKAVGLAADPEKLIPCVVPEPDNPHDSSALRVDVNDVKVGYIARNDQDEYKKITAQPHRLYIESIKGGNQKYPEKSSGMVWYQSDDYAISLCIEITG